MGIADKLNTEVMGWGTLGIIVVIMSVVLLKFKTANPGGAVCPTSPYLYYNSTSNLCCNGTATTVASCGQNTTMGTVGSSIDTFVSALSEPKNWVAIAIIAMIGFGILYLFKKKN